MKSNALPLSMVEGNVGAIANQVVSEYRAVAQESVDALGKHYDNLVSRVADYNPINFLKSSGGDGPQQ